MKMTTRSAILGLVFGLALVSAVALNWAPSAQAALRTPTMTSWSQTWHVPANPRHPFGACTGYKAHGATTQWFNSNQIEEHASVLFGVDTNSVFCGTVAGHGYIVCHFGCTGTTGFTDLYYCYNSNCTSNTKVEHAQAQFTTDYVLNTFDYSNGNAYQLYQAITGVPCGGSCYWYTPSNVVNSVSA